ncbi:hypothetical protein G6321_00042570 [Bradyrhizobium barranii subsp. barranii]|uniref:Uncharacterized protein n=1 Tax=Bradyrhizobium barranii subsp. barranii TaxID=2823807 RepID=A0A7Z0QF56_9BRAD|nr:hypothetical protein [Bradyrhizobium barranii]UGX92332.1 hypothetical protein G6321_00042570 [Bradyrhizobium barranii subsp. barranii]
MADRKLPTRMDKDSPVRVRLRRINADVAKPYPPSGDGSGWWARLKAALGTSSSDFVNATLLQLQSAARLPNSGLSDVAMNAALGFIENAKPQTEIEAALVIQMACTHAAGMAVLSRVGGGQGGDRHVAMMAAAASKLLRAYALQVETLRRMRVGGSQFIRIEHIRIEPNAQAVIGNLQSLSKGVE